MIIIHTHLFLRIAPPLVIVEDCFEKLFLKNLLFEDGMETCRVLNLFKRKAERFWVDWHFQRKVETFRMLEGPPRLSLSPDSRRKFTFCKNKKCNIFWSWECWSSYCRMLNREKKGSGEVGKIYDLLFVRVVKMCSVSSFHTKDIKLDSINNRALEQWSVDDSDVKSELF